MNNIPIEWKNIFNTDHRFGYTINTAFEIADTCKYPYIAWNGRIYDVKSGKDLGRISNLGI